MKTLYRLLFALHIFVGLGAMAGGMAAILNPEAPLGVSVDALKNSPFENYLIPGIILFTVVGLGNILGAAAVWLKWKYQVYVSGIFTSGIAVWIIVQCIMLQGIHPLHVIYFTIGAVGALMCAAILFKEKLFPANIIIGYYNKLNREV